MRKLIGVLTHIFLLSGVTFVLSAQSTSNNIHISEIEFPDSINVGDVVMLKGVVKNNGNLPIETDFNINFCFEQDMPNNSALLADEFTSFTDYEIQPGESKTFSHPVYISNQRVATNTQNVILVWPSRIGQSDVASNPKARMFYAADEGVIVDCESINASMLENVINIDGLWQADQSEICVVDQFHRVLYYCKDNCPKDQIKVNTSTNGYYMVKARLAGDDYNCSDFDVLHSNYTETLKSIIESFSYFPNVQELLNNSIVAYLLNLWNDISVAPNIYGLRDVSSLDRLYSGIGCGIVMEVDSDYNLTFDGEALEGLIGVNITNDSNNASYSCSSNCVNSEGLIQLPDFDNIKYKISIDYASNGKNCSNFVEIGGPQQKDPEWSNSLDVCSNQAFTYLPIVSDIYNTSALVKIPGFFTNGNLELKEESATEWTSLPANSIAVLLSDLNKCTSYLIRTKYNCNGALVYSKAQSFTTDGCATCSIDAMDLYVSNVQNTSAILSWDIVPGALYHLNYKLSEESSWSQYDTRFPFVVLLGLGNCLSYDFSIEMTCSTGLKSGKSKTINFVTGNCKAVELNNKVVEIDVHPKPAENFIELDFNGLENPHTINIYNASGDLVKQQSMLKPFNSNATITVNDLSNGFYFVQVYNDNKVYNGKFIKK